MFHTSNASHSAEKLHVCPSLSFINDCADLNNSSYFTAVSSLLGPESRLWRSDLKVSPFQVMQVVREQITRTLSSKPTSLELFKNKVNALNYSEILKLRQTERLHQEETLAPPVL